MLRRQISLNLATAVAEAEILPSLGKAAHPIQEITIRLERRKFMRELTLINCFLTIFVEGCRSFLFAESRTYPLGSTPARYFNCEGVRFV